MKTTKNNSTIAESRPRRFGKSTLLEDIFLVAAKAGESAIYQHPDYVCLTRKAYEALHRQREELLDSLWMEKRDPQKEWDELDKESKENVSVDEIEQFTDVYNEAVQQLQDKITALRSKEGEV